MKKVVDMITGLWNNVIMNNEIAVINTTNNARHGRRLSGVWSDRLVVSIVQAVASFFIRRNDHVKMVQCVSGFPLAKTQT